MPTRFRIEPLLSAHLFVSPQIVGEHLYFISDLSGRLSLYRMKVGDNVPEPLIPPDIALPNPHHMEGSHAYRVLPGLGKILLMLDHEGDENYQPMFVPIEGGTPQPIFGERFAGQQVICALCEEESNLAAFVVDLRSKPIYQIYRVDLAQKQLLQLYESEQQTYPAGANSTFSQFVIAQSYTSGDVIYYLSEVTTPQTQPTSALLFGTPLADRQPDEVVALSGLGRAHFTPQQGLLVTTALFDDCGSLGYLHLDQPQKIQPVEIVGIQHRGLGELTDLTPSSHGRYLLHYNIDGVSWLYEGSFDESKLRFVIERVLCGTGKLSGGVLESVDCEASSGRFTLSFSTATTPSQLYLIDETGTRQLTNERILGIDPSTLAAGEDASFVSHDGLRISARLYLPAPELGYGDQRPVIFYIHGGPQSQERPDFTWFSMPLIQFFTLNGFAVFVPNVRGSTGYGMKYMKWIDHDWGGLDRLDHVAAFEQLRSDPRLDMSRAGVMGRSYGGYMTLTQVGRHPELWKAACDMFGPYNLFTFMDRLPETWKSYFYIALGHPEQDRDFLIERSPKTHIDNMTCPMLVIQGANDPRVIEAESSDVVEQLRAKGKTVDYIVFEDEGHDVIKYKNKVVCYSRIAEFFAEHLKP